jgi:hypothetical protein
MRRLLRKPLAWIGAAFGIAAGALIYWAVNHYAERGLETVTRAPPLKAFADFDNGVYNDGALLVLPGPKHPSDEFRDFYGTGDCDALLNAARAEGAVHTSPLRLRITLEGNTVRNVSITEMRAKILRRSARLTGARVTCPSGGVVNVPRLRFDLDSPDPIALTPSGQPFFEGRSIPLTKGESQTISVSATTREKYVEWLLQIVAVIDNERRKINVTNDGHPFQVTAPRCGPRAYSPSFDLDIDRGFVVRRFGSCRV